MSLLATRLVLGCAITDTLSKSEWTLQMVHMHANFNRWFCFLLLTFCTHRGPTIYYNQNKLKITESKENKSIHRHDLSGSTGPVGGCQLRLWIFNWVNYYKALFIIIIIIIDWLNNWLAARLGSESVCQSAWYHPVNQSVKQSVSSSGSYSFSHSVIQSYKKWVFPLVSQSLDYLPDFLLVI